MAKVVQGREALLAKLKAMAPEAKSAIKQALAESADEITDMQRRLVPARTGALRDSIGSTFGTYKPENSNVRGVSASSEGGDPDLTVTIHAGNAKAWYAAFVEFGTAPHDIGAGHHPGAAARPYFFPAYRALKRRVKSRITRATTRAAKKVAGQ